MTTTERLRDFIVEQLGWNGDYLTDDYPLLENRVIDSLGLFRIVGFLEDEYGVKIADSELVPTNFATLAQIAEMVTSPA